jgi:hypothetical protein
MDPIDYALACAAPNAQQNESYVRLLVDEVRRLRVELRDADADAEEYLRQLKLAMHANMRKRKQLKLQDAQYRSLPVPRAVRIMDHAVSDGLGDE